MSTIKTNAILDASGGNTTTINGTTPTAYNTMGKNRIINGAMEIDQRNAGASVTPTSDVYTLDRWQAVRSQNNLSVQQVTDAPAGFNNSLKVTANSGATIGSADYWYVRHPIEGYNVADCNFGTADAATFTLSFWVKGSVTGSYSVGFHSTQGAGETAYLATYTINSANTWEYKTITVDGQTSGPWNKTNSQGLVLFFNLGVGSAFGTTTTDSWITGWYPGLTTGVQFAANASATIQFTGVQLEVGSVATEFERRPFGYELGLCQRYFTKSDNYDTVPGTGSREELAIYAGLIANAHTQGNVNFPVEMRAQPTLVFYHPSSGASNQIGYYGDAGTVYYVNISRKNTKGITEVIATTSVSECARFHFTASAEL